MNKCLSCPRKCNIDRTVNVGFCGEKSLRVSHFMLHHWEEPLISGTEKDKGSGTIFFSGCNLKCVYCQNFEISNNGVGKEISVDELIELFKKIENAGALNINLVTPTHFSAEIIDALKKYKPTIPVVWNTSGYESVEIIEQLNGLVDIFLTDLKYYSNELALKYSSAKDYFKIASESIIKMREIVGDDEIDGGLMKKGVIIRHMVLPNCSEDSVEILEWLNKNIGKETYISIMNQYLPCYMTDKFPEINRKVKPIEYKRVVNKAISLGFKNLFIQESSSSSVDYIPNFKDFDWNAPL